MNRRKVYEEQMLTRVFDFGKDHADLFPKGSVAGELIQSIGEALTAMSDHSSDQVLTSGSIRTSSVSRYAARKALQTQIARMDQTARAMKFTGFCMSRNRSDKALMAAGDGFAKEAVPVKKEFMKHGFPATFIDDLQAAVQDLDRARREQETSKATRSALIEGFDKSLHQALDDLARFDALVTNFFQDSPEVMVKWKIARHLARPPKRSKAKPDAVPEGHSASTVP